MWISSVDCPIRPRTVNFAVSSIPPEIRIHSDVHHMQTGESVWCVWQHIRNMRCFWGGAQPGPRLRCRGPTRHRKSLFSRFGGCLRRARSIDTGRNLSQAVVLIKRGGARSCSHRAPRGRRIDPLAPERAPRSGRALASSLRCRGRSGCTNPSVALGIGRGPHDAVSVGTRPSGPLARVFYPVAQRRRRTSTQLRSG